MIKKLTNARIFASLLLGTAVVALIIGVVAKLAMALISYFK